MTTTTKAHALVSLAKGGRSQLIAECRCGWVDSVTTAFDPARDRKAARALYAAHKAQAQSDRADS